MTSHSPYGIHRLVLINSGPYAYSMFPVDRPLSICGKNNSGKSAAVNALQFILLADMRDMEFGKHDHLTTRKFYFPGPGSYVLAEVRLEHGTFVVGAAGTGAAAQHALQHFVYEGTFSVDDFREGEMALPLDQLLRGLQQRGVLCAKLHPHELRNMLLGVPGDYPMDLTMVPLRGHQERYQNAWVSIFKNLIHMRNVNSQDLKQLLLHVFDIRLVSSDVDFAEEYQRVNADVLQLDDELQTLCKLVPFVEQLQKHHDRRQELRGRLHAAYDALQDRLRKWYDDYEQQNEVAAKRLRKIEPDRQEVRRLRDLASDAVKRTAAELGRVTAWLEAMRQQEAEFDLIEDLATLDREIAGLATDRDEIVKTIGAGERAVLSRLEADLAVLKARLEQIESTLEHWDSNVWEILSRHFEATDLRVVFALLNADLLRLPVGDDGEVQAADEEAILRPVRAVLSCIHDGVYERDGLVVKLARLSSFAENELKDRAFLETEQIGLNERLKSLRQDLTAAREIETLNQRRQELAGQIEERRRFRDRFALFLHERQKLAATVTRQRELTENEQEVDAQLRGLTEQERELDKEREALLRKKSAREGMRQRLEALQDGVEALPADEPAGIPFPGPFPEAVDEFMEEYTLDLRDKRAGDRLIRMTLDEVELAGGGPYLQETEEASVEALQEAVASIDQRRELLEKAKRTAVAELGNALKGLRDNYQRLEGEIRSFNRAINRRTVSNLTRIELQLARNDHVMDAIEELVKAGELKLFADDGRATDAAGFLYDWVRNQGRKLNLTHLFELRFVVFSHDNHATVYSNLDRIESHGTTITIKALVNMHLMSHLLEEARVGSVQIPYYLDEAASIDPRNQEILIEQGLSMGFTPVLASVKPQPTAAYCVRVDASDDETGLVIDETSWVVLERKVVEEESDDDQRHDPDAQTVD